MKVAKLIKLLQDIHEKHGELEVNMWPDDSDEPVELGGVSVLMRAYDNIPEGITLCGEETILGFIDGDDE